MFYGDLRSIHRQEWRDIQYGVLEVTSLLCVKAVVTEGDLGKTAGLISEMFHLVMMILTPI